MNVEVNGSQRVYNFSPGPAALPLEVLEQIQSELLNWRGLGMSVMEISHRSSHFMELLEEIQQDVRDLLNIPYNYQVLFLHGGASTQFAMLPLNLTRGNPAVDYVETGYWSGKAIEEAKKTSQVNIVYKISEERPYRIAPVDSWQCNDKAAYLHYTNNETLLGVQFHEIPKVNVPIVSDMTSDILSKPLDMEKFGIIYAGTQKNAGIAGLGLLIIRDDLLDRHLPQTPTIYTYAQQVKDNCLSNTANTFGCYVSGLVMKWLKKQGGLSEVYKVNLRKAQKLYSAIDNSKGFYINHVAEEFRSIMNVSFNLMTESLEQKFISEAELVGLTNLRGHRIVGGIRASIYNAVPEVAIDKLVDFMADFAGKYC